MSWFLLTKRCSTANDDGGIHGIACTGSSCTLGIFTSCTLGIYSIFGRFSDLENKRRSLTSSPVQGLSSLLLRFVNRRPGNVLALPLSAPSRIFGVIFRSLDDQLAFSPEEKRGSASSFSPQPSPGAAAPLLFHFADRRPGNVLDLPPSAPSRIFRVLFRFLDDQLAFSPPEEICLPQNPVPETAQIRGTSRIPRPFSRTGDLGTSCRASGSVPFEFSPSHPAFSSIFARFSDP